MNALTLRLDNLGWLGRLVGVRPREERAPAPAPLAEDSVHRLDRILVVLARREGDLEPTKILVGRLGFREAWFRSRDPLAAHEPVTLHVLLEATEGIHAIPAVAWDVRRCRGGWSGRLALAPGPAERAHLEAWLRKRSLDLPA